MQEQAPTPIKTTHPFIQIGIWSRNPVQVREKTCRLRRRRLRIKPVHRKTEEFNMLNNKVDQILGLLQQTTNFPCVEDMEKQLESLISTRLQESVSEVEKTYSAFEPNCLLKVNECVHEVTANTKVYQQTIDDLH
ncbi:hypothetical protein LXL04_028565 [Taraxacum kok-saghyz]